MRQFSHKMIAGRKTAAGANTDLAPYSRTSESCGFQVEKHTNPILCGRDLAQVAIFTLALTAVLDSPGKSTFNAVVAPSTFQTLG